MKRKLFQFTRYLVAAIFSLSLACTATRSEADNRFLNCNESQIKNLRLAFAWCELRLSDPVKVTRVTTAAASERRDAAFHANELLGVPTLVIFLLDQSLAIERSDFVRLRSVISQTADLATKLISFGVYGFSNETITVARPGAAPPAIKLALNASELLRSVSSILPLFKNGAAERNILVILSDGRYKDTDYSVGEISKQLNDAHVTVFAVTSGKGSGDLTAAQSLRRLAEETSGVFVTVSDNRSADSVVKDLRSYLVNGGFVTFSPLAKETTVEAELSNGKKVSFTYSSKLWQPTTAETPAEGMKPAAIPDPGSELDRRSDQLRSQLDRLRPQFRQLIEWLLASWLNRLVVAVAILVPGILFWLSLRARSRRKQLKR